MWQKARPLIEAFGESEVLFFRWFLNWTLDDQTIRPAHLPSPNQSVNRSGLGGRCWFVLMPDPESQSLPHLCKGIVRIDIRDIPASFGDITFRVEHDPTPHNYQHCEIRAFRNGQKLDEIPKPAKKFYQTELAKRAKLILASEIKTRGA